MSETREVMNIKEASNYLGISRETLYKYVLDQRIPAFKLGNRWKFKKTILDLWMETESRQFREPVATARRSTGLAEGEVNVRVRKD
jgi:excisionase family DNA binding protein